jgi:hypothetical protein
VYARCEVTAHELPPTFVDDQVNSSPLTGEYESPQSCQVLPVSGLTSSGASMPLACSSPLV